MPRIGKKQQGQALIVAVLVLFAVASLAALFAAMLGSHLAATGRRSDVTQLRNVAEAGLRLANEQLSYGIDGADWRPSQRVWRTGGGEVTVDVSYGPSPTQVQSRFMRIVASAVFPDNPFLRLTTLGLKPPLLTEYARFITDRYETGKPAALGVTGLELCGNPRGEKVPGSTGDYLNGTPYLFSITGPIRSNTDLVFYGNSQVDLVTRNYQYYNTLGLLRDDTIEVSGELRAGDVRPKSITALAADPDNIPTLTLRIDGETRTDLFHPSSALTSDTDKANYVNGYPFWNGTTPIANTWRLLVNLPRYTPGTLTDPWVADSRAVPRVRPPLIDATHPDMATNRYLALTRDSGNWVSQVVGGPYYNTGAFGWGWMNASGGIYVDNKDDIQYNHDLEKLRQNWLRSVGDHGMYAGGDRRGAGPDGVWSVTDMPPVGPADWWDKTGRYYAPPGVEIILHGELPCPQIEIIRHDERGADPYFWQKPDGTPILASITTPFNPPALNPMAPAPDQTLCPQPPAVEKPNITGARAVFPFPPNGVIYAEGNVRVRGVMPPARREPLTYFDGDSDYPDGRKRRYDLQVVSGGTIYIEGDILTPGIDGARLMRLVQTNSWQQMNDKEDDVKWGSRVALLARDHVCVNTTALNPRPVDVLAKQNAVPVNPDTAPTDSMKQDFYYNDRVSMFPDATRYPNHQLFPGAKWDTTSGTPVDVSTDPYAQSNLTVGQVMPAFPTDPRDTTFVYNNVRFAKLMDYVRPSYLRLFLGHSAWYRVGGLTGTADPVMPGDPLPQNQATDEPRVDIGVVLAPADGSVAETDYSWTHNTNRYTFWRTGADPTPDPTTQDVSTHWYEVAKPPLEYLPNQTAASTDVDLQQTRMYPLTTTTYTLTGSDFLRFTAQVYPRRLQVTNEDGVLETTGWEIRPTDLGYLLGPVAVAPPRWTDTTDGAGKTVPNVGNAATPLPVEIQALIYAQNGSWFILPGPWFSEDPTNANQTPSAPDTVQYPRYHEPLNIAIRVMGAITENMPAPVGDVADWTSKWSGPWTADSTMFLHYYYDPLLRTERWRRDPRKPLDPTAFIGTPRFPRMPLTPDLMVWGERISGQSS